MRASILLAIMAAALFGAATPLSKSLLGTLGPFSLAGLLYLGAGIAFAPWALRGFKARILTLNSGNRLYVAGSIIAGGVAGPVLLHFGLRAQAPPPFPSGSTWRLSPRRYSGISSSAIP
ncbi:MAG: EamA family transporter [Bacillota bacterium]|jgi:drug/metabolite transporter (DMT)-like permease